MDRFDEITVGTVAEIVHTVTADDLARFVELTGDDNKLHTDSSYASRTSFKKPVVHGMLGASFISTVIGTKLPGDGALWFSQDLEFLLPVRVGDTLTIRATVKDKLERDRIITLQTQIFNQLAQLVTNGTAKVRLLKEDDTASESPATKGTVALVIGGSGGIGRAVCSGLAASSFDVAVHYFSNKEAAANVSEEVVRLGRKSTIVGADITRERDVERMVAQISRQLGQISVIVYCPTTKFAPTKFETLRWDTVVDQLDINLKGAFFITKHALPGMLKQQFGKIIFITTQYNDAPVADLVHYISAKSALTGFARSLAFDLAPKGVLVNLVAPSMTDTDLIADIPEKTRLLAAARTPLRRLATPTDVAGAVIFLASSNADFLVGETIRVNGGQTML